MSKMFSLMLCLAFVKGDEGAVLRPVQESLTKPCQVSALQPMDWWVTKECAEVIFAYAPVIRSWIWVDAEIIFVSISYGKDFGGGDAVFIQPHFNPDARQASEKGGQEVAKQVTRLDIGEYYIYQWPVAIDCTPQVALI